MNLRFPLFALAAGSLLLSACSTSRNATDGARYEDDEVYYQPGETFISDIPEPEPEPVVSAPQEDDYYSDGPQVTNNYYGDVYQMDGFGWSRPYRPRWVMSWSPNFGWHLSYNFGWSTGWGGCWDAWNSPYDPWFYNSWGSPYGWNNWSCGSQFGGWWDPYYYWNNPFIYNGWYGYNPYTNPWYWGDDENTTGGGGFTFGPRNPVNVSTTVNSSYSGGVLVNNRFKTPMLTTDADKVPMSSDVDRKTSTYSGNAKEPVRSGISSRFPSSMTGVPQPAPARVPVTRDRDDYHRPRPNTDPSRRPDVQPQQPNNPTPPSRGGNDVDSPRKRDDDSRPSPGVRSPRTNDGGRGGSSPSSPSGSPRPSQGGGRRK